MITTAIKTATIALVIVAGTTGASFAKSAWLDGDAKVKKQPTKWSQTVNWVNDGEKVKVQNCKKKNGVRWCKIKVNGPDGWVRKSDLDFKKPGKWDDFDGDFSMCLGDANVSFCFSAD